MSVWPEWTLSLVAGPTIEPLTLEDVKDQVRVTDDHESRLLLDLITAERQYAEAYTSRALNTQTWDLWLDAFPDDAWIEIPRPPLMSVTSISYSDTNGAPHVWDPANYTVEAPGGPTAQRGRVIRKFGVAWPTTQGIPGSIAVRFVAGYGATAESVPAVIRVAIKQWVADAWAGRANSIGGMTVTPVAHSSEVRLWPYRSF